MTRRVQHLWLATTDGRIVQQPPAKARRELRALRRDFVVARNVLSLAFTYALDGDLRSADYSARALATLRARREATIAAGIPALHRLCELFAEAEKIAREAGGARNTA